MDREDTVIQQLIQLGKMHDSVRAVILTSSRANPSAPRDVFSDYDVVLYTVDPAPLVAGREWFEALGPVLISIQPGFEESGHWVPTRLVLYENGTKIDFCIRHVDDLRRLADAGHPPDDHGFIVLLDKDGVAGSLGRPTHTEYLPAVPTEAEYAAVVEEFWWDSTYVSKHLWREDLMAVKLMLDHVLKQNQLRRVLEWSIEIDRGWAWKPGADGRGLTRALDPDTSRELVETYAGGDIEDLWDSLFRTAALFRKVAVSVGGRLGYSYLHGLDDRVTIYHETVRSLDRRVTSSEDLARLLRGAYSRHTGGT